MLSITVLNVYLIMFNEENKDLLYIIIKAEFLF